MRRGDAEVGPAAQGRAEPDQAPERSVEAQARVGLGPLVKLGYYMGYAQPGTNPLELIELAREAERLGYDSAWAAEAWGVDAITPLAWLGATTSSIKLGTAIMQLPGRSPANAAMTAATLDL